MKKKVALIYGGQSVEHDVSVKGYRNVYRLIDKDKYDVLPVYISLAGGWYLETGGERLETFPVRLGDECGLLCKGEIITVDCAFPLLHGDGGEDGSVQGALECAGIPYVGESVAVSSAMLDKSLAKSVACRLGIPTAEWLTFTPCHAPDAAREECERVIGYPIFIKPTRLGSSVGIGEAYTPESFSSAYTLAAGYGTLIAERLISPKRELEIACLNLDGEWIITDPCEILSHGTYGYREKYSGITRTRVTADIPKKIRDSLKEYSRRLVREIGLRSLSRIDFFLSGEELLFNEINTMPGFTEESMFLSMLERAGVPKTASVDALLSGAMRCRS